MSLTAIALIVFAVAAAIYGASLFLQAHQRDRNALAVETAINPEHRKMAGSDAESGPQSTVDRTQKWLARFGDQLEGTRLEPLLLAPEDRLLLDRCDRNTQAGRATYLAIRLILALLLMVLVAAWWGDSARDIFIGGVVGLGAGVLLPKIALRMWASRAARSADDELPLLVDLLRLLQGIGMSMDQSLHVIAEQFRSTVPFLGHELHLANVSYNRGRTREQSLKRIEEVFDNDDLKALIRLIVQVDEHGGAVQEPLNQFGIRLRERRKMRMKELSGKLSVKMTMVMMLTLLPALMLVLAGPAAIALISSLGKMGAG